MSDACAKLKEILDCRSMVIGPMPPAFGRALDFFARKCTKDP
jgi:hypothetical protein